MEKIPLTKAIASSGFCSRRKAEELIRFRKVQVNNKIYDYKQDHSKKDFKLIYLLVTSVVVGIHALPIDKIEIGKEYQYNGHVYIFKGN